MQTGDVDRAIEAEDFMRNKVAVYDIKKGVIDQFDKYSPTSCRGNIGVVEEARVHSQHSACFKQTTAMYSSIKYEAAS
eukprot:5852130-Pyramimonas_sp.AAC.1